MKNIFLKEGLFTPLDRNRFTCGSVVQLKNNTQQNFVYKLVSVYCKKDWGALVLFIYFNRKLTKIII